MCCLVLVCAGLCAASVRVAVHTIVCVSLHSHGLAGGGGPVRALLPLAARSDSSPLWLLLGWADLLAPPACAAAPRGAQPSGMQPFDAGCAARPLCPHSFAPLTRRSPLVRLVPGPVGPPASLARHRCRCAHPVGCCWDASVLPLQLLARSCPRRLVGLHVHACCSRARSARLVWRACRLLGAPADPPRGLAGVPPGGAHAVLGAPLGSLVLVLILVLALALLLRDHVVMSGHHASGSPVVRCRVGCGALGYACL